MADILARIRQDYQRFPADQSYDLYAEDVYFKDPLNQFSGVARYQKMIGFIERWFIQPQLTLHAIEQVDDQITTEWNLAWTVPLPWKPRVEIEGWSELELNPAGKIKSHIDYWRCSRLDVVKQIVWPRS